MSSILVRNLGPNYDPLWGNGTANFLADLQAVTQCIGQRLRLFQGEWWENFNDGTPMFQSILANPGTPSSLNAMAALIEQQILGTPFTNSVINIELSYNPANRQFSLYGQVLTPFGIVTLATPSPQFSASSAS